MSKTCSVCGETKPLEAFPDRSKHESYNTKGIPSQATYEDRCRPCKAEYAREWRKKHPGYTGTGKLLAIPKEDRYLMSAISSRLMQARQRAKLSNLEFDIDREYLYLIFKKQQGLCALSGVPMKVEKHAVACLSLDKVVPEIGYIKGNVQWVAWAVNRAKGDMNHDVFIDMCQKVLDYQKVQRLS